MANLRRSENSVMELKDLGFDDWFRKNYQESPIKEHNLARVIAVNKENYIIRNTSKEMLAEITGKMMYEAESNLDLPVVGDWIYAEFFNQDTFAIIRKILPRKSLLKRKVAGQKIEYQPIASNIDIAFIVQSSDFDFNLRRLERYLIMANENNIIPVILLSKLDLVSPEALEREIDKTKSLNPDYEIIAFSNETSEGLDDIRNILQQGKTYCLLGSSGVGKTTLINRLIGYNIFRTDTVREKDGKGKHITARRQLIILEQGGMIIDTPGMRELGQIGVEKGLSETFRDIIDLAQNCHFKDCTHTNETGCAVVTAIETGELSIKRYQNYLKIRKESQFYEMSYLEKRRKDKKFGKLCRSVKEKNKKKYSSGF